MTIPGSKGHTIKTRREVANRRTLLIPVGILRADRVTVRRFPTTLQRMRHPRR